MRATAKKFLNLAHDPLISHETERKACLIPAQMSQILLALGTVWVLKN